MTEIWVWVTREEKTRIEVYTDRHCPEVWVLRGEAEIGPIDRDGRCLLKMSEEIALRKGLL